MPDPTYTGGMSLRPGFRLMTLIPRIRSVSTADCGNTAYR